MRAAGPCSTPRRRPKPRLVHQNERAGDAETLILSAGKFARVAFQCGRVESNALQDFCSDVLYFAQMFSPPRRDDVDVSNRRERLIQLTGQLQPPPRHVELSLLGRIGAGGVAIFLVLLIRSVEPLLQNGRRVDPVDLAFFVILLVLGLPAALRMIVRSLLQRKLLQTGACSVGIVVFERKSGGAIFKKTRIVFEFPVGGHKPMSGQGSDLTKSYKADSPVVVFYNPNDISKYVALCSTVWRVRTKDGVLLEP